MVAAIPSRFTSTLLFNSEYSKQKLFQYSFCSCHKFSSKFKEKKNSRLYNFHWSSQGKRRHHPAYSPFHPSTLTLLHETWWTHTYIHTSKHVPQHVHRLLRWGEVNRKIIDGAVTGKRKYYLQTVWFIKMHRFGLPSNVLVTNSNYKPGSTGEKCETTLDRWISLQVGHAMLNIKKVVSPFSYVYPKNIPKCHTRLRPRMKTASHARALFSQLWTIDDLITTNPVSSTNQRCCFLSVPFDTDIEGVASFA